MPQYHYTQLSQKEREQIEEMLGLGFSITGIAEELGRSKGTISREIKRNGIKDKNLRSRVNKPSVLGVDNRHLRGSRQVAINRKKREEYHERLRKFNRNKAHYSAKVAKRTSSNRKTRAMKLSHPRKLQPGDRLFNRYRPRTFAGALVSGTNIFEALAT